MRDDQTRAAVFRGHVRGARAAVVNDRVNTRKCPVVRNGIDEEDMLGNAIEPLQDGSKPWNRYPIASTSSRNCSGKRQTTSQPLSRTISPTAKNGSISPRVPIEMRRAFIFSTSTRIRRPRDAIVAKTNFKEAALRVLLYLKCNETRRIYTHPSRRISLTQQTFGFSYRYQNHTRPS